MKPEPPCEELTPGFRAILSWVVEQLRQNPKMATCNTLAVISDTRSLDEISHWRHTGRWITERTKWKGPDSDEWFALFVPSKLFKCHFVWTAVYILLVMLQFIGGSLNVTKVTRTKLLNCFRNNITPTYKINLAITRAVYSNKENQ